MRGSAHLQNPYKLKHRQPSGEKEKPRQKLYMHPASG
jgi:hypothetical protein